MSYELSDKPIEEVINLKQSTTMIRMLKYSDDFHKSTGSIQLWFKDTTSTAVATDNLGFVARQIKIIQKPATKAPFSFFITRKGNNDAIFRAAEIAAGKVNLTKVSLWMQHVTSSDTMRSGLFNYIYLKVRLDVDFCSRICEYNSVIPNAMVFNYKLSGRTERPRYILFAFQTNKRGNQKVNPAVFDNCDLKAISLAPNGERYPTNDYNLTFAFI
ncbi:uncharacterized protein LOC124816386 [Hydra vulgaris]|uniref:uncharacterized protein LOC124816386 n=1 Tax=Hydra vulgaris TaxID=6087 RepID=UPI001F5F86EA|nr:uncharacterized protein LOC124816386 [Hydra vulgaris]